ncbi:peptide chain release factor N(5)-glutamine methyltransferase [Pelagibacteraceae bacterium]|nr:peptide chain release factor N(5)-glutamine methyltransferase [Pelagibacteraceae bacterium]
MVTVEEVFLSGIQKLNAAQVENPNLDAKIIFKHILSVDNEQFELCKKNEISSKITKSYFELIDRRIKREPIAYITNKQSFWNDEFKVTKDTLIPRPETELILESVISYFPDKKIDLNIADLGTGSGCIIISLLQEYINASGIGIDISKEAIKIANENKKLLKNHERLKLLDEDYAEYNLNGFDIIVSNPPYISQNSLDIQKDVYDYEPHLALFSKKNGIEAYNKIISNLASRIDKNFFLFLEIGYGQASEVTKLLKNKGFTEILTKVDLANIPRCVIAKKIIN